MNQTHYIWEKVMVAVVCLASSDNPFEKRLFNAWSSALERLTLNGAPSELADDLRWILEYCHENKLTHEETMKPLSPEDREKMVDKLIHVLITTSRLTAHPR